MSKGTKEVHQVLWALVSLTCYSLSCLLSWAWFCSAFISLVRPRQFFFWICSDFENMLVMNWYVTKWAWTCLTHLTLLQSGSGTQWNPLMQCCVRGGMKTCTLLGFQSTWWKLCNKVTTSLERFRMVNQDGRCKNTVGKYEEVPTAQTPGQLIVGKECRSEQKLRRSIKRWHSCQAAVPPSCSSSWHQAKRWLSFNQETHFFPLLFMFLLFSLFTIRVVYNSLACSLRIFGSPSLAVLYWIGKDGWFFQSPRALKCMQAGIQSP